MNHERSIFEGSPQPKKDYSCSIGTTPMLENKSTSCCDIDTCVEQYVNIGVGTDDNFCDEDYETPVNICNANEVSLNLTQGDVTKEISHETESCSESNEVNDDTTQMTIHDNETHADATTCVEDPTQFANDERQYKLNIFDRRRNTRFIKMVHDSRNGENIVYGQTDDMMISVDENKRRYESHAIYDRKDSKKINAIYELLQRWPSAKPDKCRYGVDTLRLLLPDIIEHERQTYQTKEPE